MNKVRPTILRILVTIATISSILVVMVAMASTSAITNVWLPFISSAPSYPSTIYHPLPVSTLETRYQDFLSRNGNIWHIELDSYGFVQRLSTDDPNVISQDPSTANQFSNGERDQWLQFIHHNADFFGITTTQNISFEQDLNEPRLTSYQLFGNLTFRPGNLLSTYEEPLELFKRVETIPKYRVLIIIIGHFWPNAVVPTTPQLSPATIAAQFVGTLYTYREVIYPHPCDPPPGYPCPSPAPPTVITHTVTIQQRDLTITLLPHLVQQSNPERLELRLIYLIELNLPYGWTKVRDAITGKFMPS
jgi:hypothetical protein